jgi:release factor glutamine methyltransferase
VSAAAGPTVLAALDEAARRLREAGVDDPARDATTLLAHVLGTDRGGVVARRPDAIEGARAATFHALVDARARRVPMQHLTGTVEFHGLTLGAGPAALIPRPETEDLVDAVLAAGLPDDAKVVDLGTGTGCIAIALAAARPGWTLTAVDQSGEALALAADNATRNGVASRITFLRSDFADVRVPCDAVVSNPPYISEEEWRGLAPEVRDHEPKAALVPGPSGTEAYAAIAPAAKSMLRPGGLLAFELGWTSEPAVRAIVEALGFTRIDVRPDLQGIPRVLTARR